MIAYTLMTAKDSKAFDKIIVASDSSEICEIGNYYGADEVVQRDLSDSTSTSLDIDWLTNLFNTGKLDSEFFAILRPTSPLRSVQLINDCIKAYFSSEFDSLRTVKLVSEHPGKMWKLNKSHEIIPYLNQPKGDIASHAKQYHSLEKLYVQTSVLEIAKTSVIPDSKTREGNSIFGFITEGIDSHSLDTLDDLEYLEYLCTKNPDLLYKIPLQPFRSKE